MRILQVSSPLQRGGGEVHVMELTAALRARGHDVVIAGRRGSAAEPQVEFPFLNALDVFTVLRLRAYLKRERFDVVHAHAARDYPLAAGAAKRLPVKVVLTRHLLYPVRPRSVYRRVDGWIAPTRQILETLAPLRPRASAVIPNWVDLEKFAFKPHAPRQPITLGVLGQISPHKGHEDAIDALRLLGPGYRLAIGGNGPGDFVRALKKKSQGLEVELRGFVEPATFLASIEALLVPSWEEPFGLVVLEAMACGTPVIATAAGGPLDILRPGIDGILVPPRNPQALADAVRSLQSGREIMVREARARVESHFHIKALIPRIETFYREL